MKTPAQRQRKHYKRLVQDGGRRLTVQLPPELNRALNTEMKRTGESAQAVIIRMMGNLQHKENNH